MLAVKLISSFLTNGAITLIDHKGVAHHCGARDREPSIVVRLSTPTIGRRLLFNPQLAAGEGYMKGEITIDRGTLRDLMEMLFRHQQIHNEITWASWLPYAAAARSAAARLLHFNSPALARSNVKYHYDIGNSFYEKFLDPAMQYTCAYFPESVLPTGREQALARYHEQRIEDLDSAQLRKISLIIGKLQIREGMRVLDVGCGWGGLAIEIAKRTKAHVVGISLSEEQLRYARRKAAEAGISHRVQFQFCDYRNINATFDRIVGVGVFEHVGKSHYKAFFATMKRALAPDGVFLLQTIGRMDRAGGTNPWLRKYIFPGGYIPALTEIAKASETSRLMLSDVEVLRLHYAFTLREWSRRFAEAADQIKEQKGEEFVRMWQLYLTASEMAFVYGRFVAYQLQFVGDRFSVPITRDYLSPATASGMGGPESGATCRQTDDSERINSPAEVAN